MDMALPIPPPRYGLDAPFTLAVLALLAVGLVMVASASVAVAEKSTGAPLYYFYKQLTYAMSMKGPYLIDVIM